MERFAQFADSARRTINRHFPIRVIGEFARIHDTEEEHVLTPTELFRLTPLQIEQQAQSIALEGVPTATAWILQRAGIRRKRAKEIMDIAFMHNSHEIGEEIEESIQQIALGQSHGAAGMHVALSIRLFIENEQDNERLYRRSRLIRFLDRIL